MSSHDSSMQLKLWHVMNLLMIHVPECDVCVNMWTHVQNGDATDMLLAWVFKLLYMSPCMHVNARRHACVQAKTCMSVFMSDIKACMCAYMYLMDMCDSYGVQAHMHAH